MRALQNTPGSRGIGAILQFYRHDEVPVHVPGAMVTRRQAGLGLFAVTSSSGRDLVWMKQALNSLESEVEYHSETAIAATIVASRFLIAFVLLLAVSNKARKALLSKEDWFGGLISWRVDARRICIADDRN